MPPEPVTGFCILPRRGDDVEDGGPHGGAVAAAGLRQLPEGRRVEVQPLDGDPHLVGADRRVGVQPAAPPAAARRPGRAPGARRARALSDSSARRAPVSLVRCRRTYRARRVLAEDSPVGSPVLRRPAARDQGGGTVLEQPYEYSARELVEPDWRRLPGFADVTDEQWRSAQWQRANCVEEPPPAARRLRRPARRVVLRRRRGRPGRPGDDVAAAAAADAQHDGARRGARRRPRCSPTRCAGTCSRSPPTGCPARPRATRTPPATRCTSTRCGPSRASPTATPPRCWPSCCRPARSTAATAPAWTWWATRRPPSPS